MLTRKYTNLILEKLFELKNGVSVKLGTSDGTTTTLSTDELKRATKASARFITTTATALSLTITQHAEKIILIESDSTVANTFTLPLATGSGNKITFINNIAQTQGTVVIAANGTTNTLEGICTVAHSTTTGGQSFQTSATSDKITLNLTTTGGKGGDLIEAWDKEADVWYVRVVINASGSAATPFSAT